MRAFQRKVKFMNAMLQHPDADYVQLAKICGEGVSVARLWFNKEKENRGSTIWPPGVTPRPHPSPKRHNPSVINAVKKLLNKKTPDSDSMSVPQIADALQNDGVDVSVRTVRHVANDLGVTKKRKQQSTSRSRAKSGTKE